MRDAAAPQSQAGGQANGDFVALSSIEKRDSEGSTGELEEHDIHPDADGAERVESRQEKCAECGQGLLPPSQPQMSRNHSQAASIVSSLRSRTRRAAEASFQHPLEKQQTTPAVIVEFSGPDDPYCPLNWPVGKKLITTILYALTTASMTFASSVFSPAIPHISAEFHVSDTVCTLGLALLLFGFGLGPLIWGPLSELYGRKYVILAPFFIAGLFVFATGAAKDVQTIMLSRFFSGFFGAAPVVCVGAVMADIWHPAQRGIASASYALTVVGGPTLGPLVGGAITGSSLSWRWTQYVTGILIMAVTVAGFAVLNESYHPVLLAYKARRLRHRTNNWALHARHEEWDPSFEALAKKYLVRPLHMLGTPICALFGLYASFVYGILYANLSAFPIEYERVRGWGPVVGALPFVALLMGMIGGFGVIILNQKYYFRRMAANAGRPVPEARLPPMMLGAVVFAGGLFIFAWTADPHTHWIGSVIGCALVGFGFFTIFTQCMNYLIDTFKIYSASAVAANTFVRSCFAGAFPIFTLPMYNKIGVSWGTTVFACFSVAMIPIPFLFFVFGERIRRKGTWSKEST